MSDLEERIDWSEEELLLEIGRAQDSASFGAEEAPRRELIENALTLVAKVRDIVRDRICSDPQIKALAMDQKIQNRLNVAAAVFDIVIKHGQSVTHGFELPSASTAVLISRTSLFELCKAEWLQ